MTRNDSNSGRHRAFGEFAWAMTSAGRTLSCAGLSPMAAHVFTTRQLAFRADTSDRDYERLAQSLGVPVDAVVRVRQVHGREVLVLRPGDLVPAPNEVASDAIVTTDPALVASVRIADCVPVLVGDRRRRVVAAIHAGWRGTAAGVAAETIKRIGTLGIEPRDLVAAIGPSIGPCCYQVDRAVLDACASAWPGSAAWFAVDGASHWRFDLWRANRDQLVRAGVPPESIWIAGLCTADRLDDFYSHRREGARAGRLVAAVRLPP